MLSLGGFSKQSPVKPIVVLAGGVAILPCYFSEDDDPLFVEWSEESLHPNVVLLYRGGKEEHRMKDEAFRHRASLYWPEMDNSNMSLRIADVQLSDEGNYTCKSILKSKNKVRNVATVWLSVGKCVGLLEVELISTGPLVLSQSGSGPHGPTSVTRGAELFIVALQLSFSTFVVVLTNSNIVRTAQNKRSIFGENGSDTCTLYCRQPPEQ